MYTEYAYSHGELDHSQAYLFSPILRLIRDKKDYVILDLGCGNGSLVNKLIELGYNAYGIDASKTGIEIAKSKNPNRFFCYDITQGELPDELKEIKFDLIISTEVIEHVYSPAEFLQLCKSILSKSDKGELLISTPYHGYIKNLVLALTGKWDKHLDPSWEGGHIKFWSKETLSAMLKKYSFQVLDFIGCGRYPYIWKSMIIYSKINE